MIKEQEVNEAYASGIFVETFFYSALLLWKNFKSGNQSNCLDPSKYMKTLKIALYSEIGFNAIGGRWSNNSLGQFLLPSVRNKCHTFPR